MYLTSMLHYPWAAGRAQQSMAEPSDSSSDGADGECKASDREWKASTDETPSPSLSLIIIAQTHKLKVSTSSASMQARLFDITGLQHLP